MTTKLGRELYHEVAADSAAKNHAEKAESLQCDYETGI
tara:strand:+ start:359 stop:472 length:114 start_codon:yes stop_codon:yes gene_type:complete